MRLFLALCLFAFPLTAHAEMDAAPKGLDAAPTDGPPSEEQPADAGVPAEDVPPPVAIDTAQQAPAETAPLSERLSYLRDEVDRYRQEVRQASGENKEIAEEHLEEVHSDLFGLIDTSIANKSAKDPAAVSIIGAIALAESAQLYHEIHHLERDLTKLFAIRGRLTGKELLKAEGDIADESRGLDRALWALIKNMARKDKLGLAVEQDFRRVETELIERAKRLAATVRSTVASIEKFEKRNAGSDNAQQMIQDELHSLRGRLDSVIESLKHTIELMDERHLDAAEYRQLIIEATGDLSTDILDIDVAKGLLGKYAGEAKTWLVDHGPILLFRLILAFLIFMFSKFLARIVRWFIRLLVRRSKASEILGQLAVSVGGNAIVLVGAFIALWQLGLSPAPILAGLGIAGLVIGLALQDTLSSVAAGVMILLYRPFDVGDLLETQNSIGVVKSMNLMTTTLVTLQNERITIPNNKIWGDVIKNITGEPYRRIDMVFGISYADDIDKAKEILDQVVTSASNVLPTPAPSVRVLELGDSSVNFAVRPYVEPPHYWDVYFDITEEVKRRFDAEGVSIPFPQRDVHLIQEQPG